jgi:hypothetical protein
MIPLYWWKDEDSSRPTVLYRIYQAIIACSKTKTAWVLINFSLCLLLTAIYYGYLNHLYIVDGPYDLEGPRELTILQKTTIKVLSTKDLVQLQEFVLRYSICPTVDKIIILWHNDNQVSPNPVEYFKYTTAHSLVEFEKISLTQQSSEQRITNYYSTDNIRTEGKFYISLFL